jgi:L-ascorbate metabolism protein UlaG (beta-lactamase superfamily)
MHRILFLAFLACASCAGVEPHGGGRQAFRDYYTKYKLKPAETIPAEKAITVTFLGTSTLLFDDGEKQVLVDGFVSRSGWLQVGLGHLSSHEDVIQRVVKQGQMERLAAAFVTHSHYDHALDIAEIIKAAQVRKAQQTHGKSAQEADEAPPCVDPVTNVGLVELHGSESTREIGRGGSLVECQLKLLRPGEVQQVGRFRVRVFLSKHSPPTVFNNDLGQGIRRPLRQPARARAYKEGGSYDVLITHGEHSILVKAGANYIEGMLEGVRADVLFLAIGRLGMQKPKFRDSFYEQTVAAVHPRLVVATHWDDFFEPLSENMPPAFWPVDNVPAGLDFLSHRLEHDGIQLGLMQGFQRIVLFDGLPAH